ncbi:MAG: hypothetical protein AAB853_00615 [Patescibacteria group bacterium]
MGDWQLVDRERQVLQNEEGEIRMKFLGGEINLVLGLEQAHPSVGAIAADVEIDGEHVKSFEINKDDLFNLFTGEYGEHEIILRLNGKGISGYAFTFGS